MAFQAGQYRANTTEAQQLQDLSNSLSKFGGALTQKQQLENKQKEIDLRNKEEAEFQQAQEIFEGERGKDIYNEYQFATKKGNQRYQELKAGDEINNNYQASVERGAANGWTTEQILKDFEETNNRVIKDKKYHQDFKNAYVNSTIKYEDKIKSAANQERVSNLNKEFERENTKAFFNGMRTEGQDPNELISNFKEKVGSNYNNYAANIINIATNRGVAISGDYLKEFDELGKGDLNVQQALSRNVSMANKKVKQTNALLKEQYDIAKENPNASVRQLEQAFIPYVATLDGNEREKAQIAYNYHLSAVSVRDFALAALAVDDKTAYDEVMNSEDVQLISSRGNIDVEAMVESAYLNDVNYEEPTVSDVNLIQNYAEKSGKIPKGVGASISNALSDGSYESLTKVKPLLDNFYNDLRVRDGLKKEQIATWVIFDGMNKAGTSTVQQENLFNERKERVINESLKEFTPKEKVENREDIFNQLENIMGIDVDDLQVVDQENFGVITNHVNNIEWIMSTANVSAEKAAKIYAPTDKNGNNYLRSMFVERTGSGWFGEKRYAYRGTGSASSHTEDETLIKEEQFPFIKKNLIKSDGTVNSEQWNIPPQLAKKVKNGDIDEDDFAIRTTERTERDGYFELVFIDPDTGIEEPITSTTDQGNFGFIISPKGELAANIDNLNKGAVNSLTLPKDQVEDYAKNSLKQQKVEKVFNQSNKKTSDRFIPTTYQDLTKTKTQEYTYHSAFKKVDKDLNELNTVSEKPGYKTSKNTKAFVNKAMKGEEKAYKKEINNEYFADEIQQFNRNIQSAISKGKEYYKDMKYSVRMAVEELKSIELFGSEEDENQLKMGNFDNLVEKYNNYGRSEKVKKELIKEQKTANQQQFVKYQEYNAKMPYNDRTQKQDQRLLTLMKLPINAKSETRLNMFSDVIAGIESSLGNNLINKKSSATGIYQFMTANGKGKNPFIGSSLDVAINRVKNTYGSIPPELAELQKLGKMTLEGKTVKDPEYKAFRNKFASLPHDLQHMVFNSHVFQEKGTNDIMNIVVNGNTDEFLQAVAKYYVENHNKDINQLDYDAVIKKAQKILGDDLY